MSNSLAKLDEEDWDEGLIRDVAGAMFAGEYYSTSYQYHTGRDETAGSNSVSSVVTVSH